MFPDLENEASSMEVASSSNIGIWTKNMLEFSMSQCEDEPETMGNDALPPSPMLVELIETCELHSAGIEPR